MVTRGGEAGASLIELLVTVALVATVTALGAPLIGHARDAHSGRQAAALLTGHLRSARQHAVLSGQYTAVVFDRVTDVFGDVWGLTTCVDGDGDGVSRADITAGIDACHTPVQPMAAWIPHTVITDLTLGTARLVSFGPLGTSSSGSLVITTRRGQRFMVRVAGVTGRVRWEVV